MNVLLIGRNSFIGHHLKYYLSKKLKIKIKDYKEVINKKVNFFNQFSYIINCTSNKTYVEKRYLPKNDFDYQIAKKINNSKTSLVFLSSRKIYFPKANISETSIIKPKCNYSKNKFITERRLKKILKNRVLILRISNLIGYRKFKNKRKLHRTFIDVFFENINKGLILDNKNIYKDFISIKKFCEIVKKLLLKNVTGTYNISIGKRVYLKKMTSWLNFYNSQSYKIIENFETKNNRESFYLNNKKLMKTINVKNSLSELKNECMKISKSYFNKNA